MNRRTFLCLVAILLLAFLVALLCSCSEKKKQVGGYAAPPECVQVKCLGTWMVKDTGVYCKGRLAAVALCYQAPHHVPHD